jgi:signal transduction histidine kinase
MILPASADTVRAAAAGRILRAPLLAIALGGAIAIVVSLSDLPRVVVDRSYLLLLCLTVATGLTNFRMLGARFTFSVSDTFTMTAAVLFGPAAATVLVAFDAFTMSLRLTRENRTASCVSYNTTAPALAMWIAAHAFDALAPAAFRAQPTPAGRLVIPLMMFAALYFVLNSGFIAMAVAEERRESVTRVWAAHFARLWYTFFVGASVAGLLVLLAGVGSGMVIVLLVPLVIVLYAAAMEHQAHAAAVATNRLKDEFLAAVSHELRTPATSILGWARLLRDGRLDEKGMRKALDALERSAHAQATVLNDLLDISRVVRGALRLELRRTAVMTPLGEAIEMLEPALKAKDLHLDVTVQSALPTIDADSDRLRQVFWNLLSNAIKFTPAGGHIDISARHTDNDLVIDVRDNGQGIDPAFLPFVFDKFRQGDASPGRVHGGLGLGLTIVRYVVESHGGAVEAWSEGAGRGARFTVRLQVSSRARESDAPDLSS